MYVVSISSSKAVFLFLFNIWNHPTTDKTKQNTKHVDIGGVNYFRKQDRYWLTLIDYMVNDFPIRRYSAFQPTLPSITWTFSFIEFSHTIELNKNSYNMTNLFQTKVFAWMFGLFISHVTYVGLIIWTFIQFCPGWALLFNLIHRLRFRIYQFKCSLKSMLSIKV